MNDSEKRRSGRAIREFAHGDFRLYYGKGKTKLVSIAPTSADTRVIGRREHFEEWKRDEWSDFIEDAKRFDRKDLIEELRGLKSTIIEERISREEPVFDDDSKDMPEAVHSLRVHHSQREGYIRVLGPATHREKEELRSLGLRWNPERRLWETGFSQDLLESVAELVRRESRTYNPDEIGYERCPNCGRWHPEETNCSCTS